METRINKLKIDEGTKYALLKDTVVRDSVEKEEPLIIHYKEERMTLKPWQQVFNYYIFGNLWGFPWLPDKPDLDDLQEFSKLVL